MDNTRQIGRHHQQPEPGQQPKGFGAVFLNSRMWGWLEVVSLSAPYALFLVACLVIPLGFIVYQSFQGDNGWTAGNYQAIATQSLYFRVLFNTLYIAASATIISIIIGYPVAYHLSLQPKRRRTLLMILVFLPFWTSILVKSFAFTVILGNNGIINQTIVSIFGHGSRLELLYNRPGVVIGMAHYLLPFMILSILSNLVTQDPLLRQAAETMGASRTRIFFTITLPISLPSVVAGSVICVILSMAMYITPTLLGGRGDMMISSLIDFHLRETFNWNLASALAVCLIIITALLVTALATVGRPKVAAGEPK